MGQIKRGPYMQGPRGVEGATSSLPIRPREDLGRPLRGSISEPRRPLGFRFRLDFLVHHLQLVVGQDVASFVALPEHELRHATHRRLVRHLRRALVRIQDLIVVSLRKRGNFPPVRQVPLHRKRIDDADPICADGVQRHAFPLNVHALLRIFDATSHVGRDGVVLAAPYSRQVHGGLRKCESDLAKDDVVAVEPRARGQRDEELGAVSVGAAGVGHGQHAEGVVLQLEVLVLEMLPIDGLPSHAIVAYEVPSLSTPPPHPFQSAPSSFRKC